MKWATISNLYSHFGHIANAIFLRSLDGPLDSQRVSDVIIAHCSLFAFLQRAAFVFVFCGAVVLSEYESNDTNLTQRAFQMFASQKKHVKR